MKAFAIYYYSIKTVWQHLLYIITLFRLYDSILYILLLFLDCMTEFSIYYYPI